jgi:glycerol-3-phosphate dehydrogenase
MDKTYDLVVIGGGINGVGIARDAAGRGLSVYLCEMGDLASGTSSHSTKLVHGGLRYLEHLEFRLVREALAEREVLMRMAPHLIRPMRFVLPHHSGLRPAWLLRLGLFLYDHLGGRALLPPTESVDLTRDARGAPLKRGQFQRGFEYSDCTVDDSRLVIANAVDAAARGAEIETRTKAVSAERSPDGWRLWVQNSRTGVGKSVAAKAVVNAAGPWVADAVRGVLHAHQRAHVRLVQGSHIVVHRLYDHDRSYVFQNRDRRIVFAIPYLTDFTLIGTTDQDFDGSPRDARPTEEEVDYLCKSVSAYLEKPVTIDDVVWSFSGVRPLYDDGASVAQSATRDYLLELDNSVAEAPLISVIGGKITVYRRLAEAVMEKFATHFPQMGGKWTCGAHLPGGDFPIDGENALQASLHMRYPFLDEPTVLRLVRAYGSWAGHVLGVANSESELGFHFGAGLWEREIEYLMKHEWALTQDDVLWRRSKLGLVMTPEGVAALEMFMSRANVVPDALQLSRKINPTK